MSDSTTGAAARITEARQDDVVILTLHNSSRRNAFTPAMREVLATRIRALATSDARALVLTGADGHFCSGADVHDPSLDPAELDPLRLRERMRSAQSLLRAIIDSPKPMVAAVEGDAFGAGLSIALGCDLIVCTSKSRFGAGFAQLGLLPDLGMLSTLPMRIGLGRAREMLLFGKRWDGAGALTVGLADHLTPVGGALAAAIDLGHSAASFAPLPLALIRSAYADGVPSTEAALALETQMLPLLRASADFAEGAAAFREKRRPHFEGR